MLLQVTIVDRDEREEQNLITRRNTALRDHQILHGLNGNALCICYLFVKVVVCWCCSLVMFQLVYVKLCIAQ
jgi:hypothetical protein